MNIVNEESCAILENLNEAIITKFEGISYCSKLGMQILNHIHQKCINDAVPLPSMEEITQYFADKKQLIKSKDENNESHGVLNRLFLRTKIFVLHQQEDENNPAPSENE